MESTDCFGGPVTVARTVEIVVGRIKFVFKIPWLVFAGKGDQVTDFSYSVSALGAQTSVRNMHYGVVHLRQHLSSEERPGAAIG